MSTVRTAHVLETHNAILQGIEVCLVRTLRRRPSPVSDLVAIIRLRRLLRRGQYDIVHTHSTKAGLIGRLAVSKRVRPVLVHTVHGWGFASGEAGPLRRLLVRAERFLAGRTDAIVVVTGMDRDTGIRHRIGKPASTT